MKWISSKAKEVLRDDIVKGRVTPNMKPVEVYEMHEGIYHDFKYDNFKINLKNLRVALQKKKEDAQSDEVRLRNTLKKKQNDDIQPSYPTWNHSEAQKLLCTDINSGRAQVMKPAELWSSRPEFKVYPVSVFRDHLYKERSKPLVKAYWDHQREMKLQKKRSKK